MSKTKKRRSARPSSRMPEDSVFYEKVIPVLLIGLGIVTAILILVAAGILLGIIPYQ